jgi:hypothetical protein
MSLMLSLRLLVTCGCLGTCTNGAYPALLLLRWLLLLAHLLLRLLGRLLHLPLV